jgi:hypothetical protein
MVSSGLADCKLASRDEHKLAHNEPGLYDYFTCFECSGEQIENDLVDEPLL